MFRLYTLYMYQLCFFPLISGFMKTIQNQNYNGEIRLHTNRTSSSCSSEKNFFFNSVFIFWTHYINKINPRVPGSLTYLRAFKGLWSQKFCIYKYKRGQFWAIFWPSLTPPLPKTNNNHQYSPSVTTTFNCFCKEISAHLISRPISCDNLIPFLVNLSLCFEL